MSDHTTPPADVQHVIDAARQILGEAEVINFSAATAERLARHVGALRMTVRALIAALEEGGHR
ncbi:hypothetical protein [Streptomyces buecherae]|uniref:hypothetical protein n=1 Tax=Streptomyces buecherae TaxID=2763006 RepID=UPI00164DA304|nr:hypothetical protein [Streptomyces buecherae]MBC3988035.1 hypothetical protein [Streptomyces buecherae]